MQRLTAELCRFLKGEDRAILEQSIYESFGWTPGSPGDGPNFEDVLNALDSRALRHVPKEILQDSPLARLRAAEIAVDGLRDFIRSKCNADSRGVYDALVAWLQPDDAIVSFNWDVLIELAFRRAQIDFTYLSNEHSQGATVVLKPHGSVNWYALLDREGLQIDLAANVDVLGRNLHSYMLYLRDPLGDRNLGKSSPSATRALASVPAIVPPYSAKLLDVGGRTADSWVDQGHESIMSAIWLEFHDLVLQADELVVLGYSLPGTDAASIETLKCFAGSGARSKKTVSVVDRNSAVLERYRTLVHPDAQLVCDSCEEYFSVR